MMDQKFNFRKFLFLIVMGWVAASSVLAGLSSDCGPYTFSWVWDEDANPDNGTIGQQQLSFTVSEVDEGVQFKLFNSGSAACSLTAVYFESSLGTLTDFVSIDDSCLGVAFSEESKPGNMPRWRKIDFEPTPTLTFHSDSKSKDQGGSSRNGINPGEWLGITLGTPADIDQICREINNQDIRVGIHVQAFSDGGSEAFVNVNIPDPATLTLLGLGALFIRHPRNKKLK